MSWPFLRANRDSSLIRAVAASAEPSTKSSDAERVSKVLDAFRTPPATPPAMRMDAAARRCLVSPCAAVLSLEKLLLPTALVSTVCAPSLRVEDTASFIARRYSRATALISKTRVLSAIYLDLFASASSPFSSCSARS
jgi:hypothetical protein